MTETKTPEQPQARNPQLEFGFGPKLVNNQLSIDGVAKIEGVQTSATVKA